MRHQDLENMNHVFEFLDNCGLHIAEIFEVVRDLDEYRAGEIFQPDYLEKWKDYMQAQHEIGLADDFLNQ